MTSTGPATARTQAAAAELPALAWTVSEAAVLLRCTESWLEEKARKREIPFTLLSGSYHFTDAHLAEAIRIFEVPAGQPQAGPVPAATRAPLQARAPSASRAPASGPAQLRARQPRKSGAA